MQGFGSPKGSSPAAEALRLAKEVASRAKALRKRQNKHIVSERRQEAETAQYGQAVSNHLGLMNTTGTHELRPTIAGSGGSAAAGGFNLGRMADPSYDAMLYELAGPPKPFGAPPSPPYGALAPLSPAFGAAPPAFGALAPPPLPAFGGPPPAYNPEYGGFQLSVPPGGKRSRMKKTRGRTRKTRGRTRKNSRNRSNRSNRNRSNRNRSNRSNRSRYAASL